MPVQKKYCGGIFRKIDYYYTYAYPYINIPICFVGIIWNLFNVFVFTRKIMDSPPNLILAHLAFVDFLVLLARIQYLCLIDVLPKSGFYKVELSYQWTKFSWYCNTFISTFQLISAYFTLQLATWRYIAVLHPLKERHWCSRTVTRNVVIIGYFLCCISFAIPRYSSMDIDATNTSRHYEYNANFERHPIMKSISDTVFGLVMKALLSVLMVVLTFRIVATLSAIKTNREHLSPSLSKRSNMKNIKIRKQTSKSTAILLAVVISFFIAEFPRGTLWFVAEVIDSNWRWCYRPLKDIFNTIAHINASITFVVYYTLSQQFRTTFRSLFNRNTSKATISQYQTHTPLALGDTEEIDSKKKTSEV